MFRFLLIFLLLPCLWGAHTLHLGLQKKLVLNQNLNQSVRLLPPAFLQMMTLGHQTLMADLLWLQLIQYYGGTIEQNEKQTHLFAYVDTLTSLDPDFEDAYVFSSYLLADQPEQAMKILKKGIEAYPQSWRIPFQAGFIQYLKFKDYQSATQYFELSAQRPNAPDLPNRFAAQLYKRTDADGHCQISIRLWQDAWEKAPNKQLKEQAEKHIIESKIQCDLRQLREAIQNFKKEAQQDWEAKQKEKSPPVRPKSFLPADLNALVRAKILTALPQDPRKQAYVYNPKSGEVKARALSWTPTDLNPRDLDKN